MRASRSALNERFFAFYYPHVVGLIRAGRVRPSAGDELLARWAGPNTRDRRRQRLQPAATTRDAGGRTAVVTEPSPFMLEQLQDGASPASASTRSAHGNSMSRPAPSTCRSRMPASTPLSRPTSTARSRKPAAGHSPTDRPGAQARVWRYLFMGACAGRRATSTAGCRTHSRYRTDSSRQAATRTAPPNVGSTSRPCTSRRWFKSEDDATRPDDGPQPTIRRYCPQLRWTPRRPDQA